MRNTIYGGTTATPTPIVNVDGKEDKSNRIDDLKVPQSDLVGKYPSALAVDDLIRTYSDGVQHELGLKADKSQIGEIETALENKVDKEEGKELYRSMELINEYTFTGEETSKQVFFSKDLNGNSFNLDELAIFIDMGERINLSSAGAYSCYVNAYGLDDCVFYKGAAAINNAKYFSSHSKRCGNGQWFTMANQNMVSETYGGVLSPNYWCKTVDYIYSVRVTMPLIQAGAKVSIYGRRVD